MSGDHENELALSKFQDPNVWVSLRWIYIFSLSEAVQFQALALLFFRTPFPRVQKGLKNTARMSDIRYSHWPIPTHVGPAIGSELPHRKAMKARKKHWVDGIACWATRCSPEFGPNVHCLFGVLHRSSCSCLDTTTANICILFCLMCFQWRISGISECETCTGTKKPPRNSLWCNHDDTASWNPPDDGPQSGRGIGPLSKVPRQIWQLNSQLNWFNWHITMFNPFGPFNWRTPCSLGVPVWCRWRSSWPFPKVGWYSYQIVSCGCIPWTLLFFQPAWIKSLVNSVKIPCGIMTWDGLQILIGGSWIKELVSCSLIISQKNGGLTCHPDSWHLVVPWSRGCHCMIRPR